MGAEPPLPYLKDPVHSPYAKLECSIFDTTFI